MTTVVAAVPRAFRQIEHLGDLDFASAVIEAVEHGNGSVYGG